MSSSRSAESKGSFLQRHDFLIRRLHSLSGLVPIGAYMCVHLITNFTLILGSEVFQNAVFAIHSLPFLLAVEWTFIFFPIIFHAVVGVWIAKSGRSNLQNYQLAGNSRYTFQRITGYFAILFIFLHVFQLHGWFHSDWWLRVVAEPLGMAQFRPYNAASSLATAMNSLGGFVWPAFYALGVIACVYHFANGLWTAGITWGIWISPKAQQRATYLCSGIGLILLIAGFGSIIAAKRTDAESAKTLEDKMYEVRVDGRMIPPDEHKRTDGHNSHRKGSGPEPIIPQANIDDSSR